MSFSHRASETVQLLKQMTPDFIPPTPWPPNSPDLKPMDYAVWGASEFTRRSRMLVNCVNRLWRNGMGTACDWQWSDSGTGNCEAVSMQTMDSLNIFCDWHSDYHNGRHCRFLSIWLYCIDCIATCSALYSQALIRFHCKEYLSHIPHSPMSVESAFSSKHLLQILRKLAHYYTNYSQKYKGLFFLWNTL